ncbi:hypothetical protein L1987_76698 [Smallanthus sonchifolius]|uniref:Uncharacterized protein n=1 Tax=Smallanthus sonchifolius TaxID=185202 RepID=A0ACB8Z8R4_9ASTR|nr:hypothetical protein L1987_76698 [Smallanthus sonchifolius]
MYRDRDGGGSKAKIDRSSTATSSRGAAAGFNLNGKDANSKDRSSPGNSKISSLSRSSYPNKKLSKGEENIVEESETDSEESDVSGSDGEDTSWISWFCSLLGNEFFCEVDENYIQDDFNLCGLSSQVPYYDYVLDLILDVESSHGDMFSEEQNEIIESAAEMLYGLIHVRYILTTKGLGAMLEKYKTAEFGRCPRVYCCGQPCLPVGQSDVSRQNNVKIFCPKCEDIYTPQSRFQDNLDGAYFGSTFPHLFLMTYGSLKPQKASQDYIPKVFGFKVHKP